MLSLSNYQAIMFDLDGTLVDTLPLHYSAYASVLKSHGLDFNKADFLDLVGPPAAQAIPLFVKAAGGDCRQIDTATVHKEKKAVFKEIISSETITVLPASRFLELVHPTQCTALVTSGNRSGAKAILANLGWTGFFDTMVTGDDVATGKPDPEPFILAAAQLKVSPDKCLAFEDTADGLASARAAGMTVLDVADIDGIS